MSEDTMEFWKARSIYLESELTRLRNGMDRFVRGGNGVTYQEAMDYESWAMAWYRHEHPGGAFYSPRDMTPEMLKEAGLLGTEQHYYWRTIRWFGMDGFLKIDSTWNAAQAKMRSASIVSANCLGSFFMAASLMRAHNPASTSTLICNKPLGKTARRMLGDGIVFSLKTDFTDVVTAMDEDVVTESTRTARDYQTDAITKINNMVPGSTGTLAMPCGTGKTFIFLAAAASRGGLTVVVSPLRIHATQVMERWKHFSTEGLLVSTDGTTDPDEVHGFTSGLISTTLESWRDVVSGNTDPTMVIFDESHRAYPEDIALSKTTTLKVSATPESMDDVVYHMSIANAIQRGYVCDYRLITPLPRGGDFTGASSKASFIVEGMARTGTRRCVVFGSRWEEVLDVIKAIKAFHATKTAGLGGGIWADVMGGDLSEVRRKILMEEFQDHDGDHDLYIMGSVRILREGIDLPKCDAVAILDAETIRETTMVQTLSRATRIDLDNPRKVAAVLLWLPEDNAAAYISKLRTEDPDFTRKLRVFAPGIMLTKKQLEAEADATKTLVETVRRAADKTGAQDAHTSWLAKAMECARNYKYYWTSRTSRDRFADGTLVGKFIEKMRTTHKIGHLPDKIGKVFVDVDPHFFDPVLSKRVNKARELVDWYYQNQKTWPNQQSTSTLSDGTKVGMAMHHMVRDYQSRSLPSEVITILQAADPFFFRPFVRRDMRNVRALIEFYKSTGRWPYKSDKTAVNGTRLGIYLDVLRKRVRGTAPDKCLPAPREAVEELEAIDPEVMDPRGKRQKIQ